jgi:DNA-binding PadR family transcriptional regulator
MVSKAMIAASTKPLLLSILKEGESYGYQIIKNVRRLSNGRLEWSFGMLYAVLHRLEHDDLVRSRWRQSGEGRLRKYYRLTEKGRKELEAERDIWQSVNAVLLELWSNSNPMSAMRSKTSSGKAGTPKRPSEPSSDPSRASACSIMSSRNRGLSGVSLAQRSCG